MRSGSAIGLGDEAVAARRNGRDRSDAEELAQRTDLHLEIVLVDDEACPDLADQLILGHDTVAMLEQHEQHVECPRTDRCRATVDQQLPAGCPDLSRSKVEDIFHRHV